MESLGLFAAAKAHRVQGLVLRRTSSSSTITITCFFGILVSRNAIQTNAASRVDAITHR